MSDTPPDPSPVLWNAHGTDVCSSPTLKVEGMLGGSPVSFQFTPDASNIMGYFGGCPPITTTSTPMHFSAQQIARMHATLEHPSRSHLLRRPWPGGGGGALLLLLNG